MGIYTHMMPDHATDATRGPGSTNSHLRSQHGSDDLQPAALSYPSVRLHLGAFIRQRTAVEGNRQAPLRGIALALN